MRQGKTILFAALCIAHIAQAQPSRVRYNNQQLWLSGANLAWINFANDIGPGPTDFTTFGNTLLQMHDNGGNVVRWWLHTNGTNTPAFDDSGRVIGPGTGTIADLRQALDLAWEREVGVILCLWSFDMLRLSNPATVLNRNRLLLTDTSYTRQYINASLIPMVDSLRGHPAIVAWEICNEPEGMSNEYFFSGVDHVPMTLIQRFTNLLAGAIHRTDTNALVTTGAWSFISLTDVPTIALADVGADLSRMTMKEQQQMEEMFYEKYKLPLTAQEIVRYYKQAAVLNFNYYSDGRLIAEGGDPDGTLDFYCVHYYSWAGTALSPFHHPVNTWGLTKPTVVAEFAMQTTFGIPKQALFDTLFYNLYAGGIPWSWTDVNLSTHEDMLAGMRYMWDHHRQAVDVLGIGGDWPVVSLVGPPDDTTFASGADIPLAAVAADSDGSVASVAFLSDTTVIGTRTGEPFSMVWTGVPDGSYRLTAAATDNQGHRRTSNIVHIRVGVPATTRLEAEDAARTGTPAIFNDPGASNGRCLRMQQTGTVTWSLPHVPEEGDYTVTWGYRLPFDTPKDQIINVNGVHVDTVRFQGSLNTWREVSSTVHLLQGSNTLQMELYWGWMDLDYAALPTSVVLSAGDGPEIPGRFSLQQNYPNPFNPETNIRFSIPRTAFVSLRVFDLLGREVGRLVNGEKPPGTYTIRFDGTGIASGVYVYRLEAGNDVAMRKMVLVK